MEKQSDLRKRGVVVFARKKGGEGPYPVLRGSAGSVLLVLIITMVILAALTAAILPTLFTTEMGQVSASRAMKAYYLAEAGGRYTLPRLGTITTGTHTFKFSGGDTFFEIEKISNARFTSTGVISEGTSLEARVAITYRLRSTFDYGLFGGDGVTIGNTVIIDGDVGTNSDNLDGISSSAVIDGEREVSAGKDMTLEALPAGAASWTDKTPELNMLLPGQTIDLTAGQYRTAAINISLLSTLNITGDVILYVQGMTSAPNNSTLNINSGASLTIYAGGDIGLANNSLINPDKIPAHFVIYGLAGCGNVTLYNNSDIYVAIYAPTADIVVWNNAAVYGSLVGETITAGNSAEIHYDEGLQNIGADSTDVEQYFTGN